MSESSEADPEDSAYENTSLETSLYCKHLDDLRKRKLVNEDNNISNMINIGQIPKEQNVFKIIVESDRLSQASEKKIEQINKRFSLLEKDIDRLREISDEKKRKSNDYIQANKARSSVIFTGEIIKQYNTCREKANDIKSAFDKEKAEIRNNEAREKTEVDNAIKELENVLAVIKERFDETKREQEKATEETNRLELEINNMKEKEAEEKDRLDRTIKYTKEQKTEINRMHNNIKKIRNKKLVMQRKTSTEKNKLERKIKILRATKNKARKESQNNIRSLQQEHDKLERQIEAEKNEMKLDETRVKCSIENLQKMLNINKDQNEKMKNIEIMQITFVKTKEEYDKNIQIIQQFKTDKELEIRAEIKRMAETEILAENKMNVKIKELDTYLKNMQDIQQNKLKTMDRNIKALTNKLAEREKAIEASCELMKQTEAVKEKEFDAEIQSMETKLSEMKDSIEKKIKALEQQRRVETQY